MKFSKNMPENMRVETKEDVIRLIEEAIDNDDGTRIPIEEVERRMKRRFEAARAVAKARSSISAKARL